MDAAAWRRLFASWATGVSIVTSEGTSGPRGCTANALTSLSLDPLLLLVCFSLSSNTLAAVRESGRFCVNVLAADQEALSRHFARKAPDAEKFDAVPYSRVAGAPVLGGCLAWVVCETREELEGGDHAIVIGSPVRGEARDDDPLVFFRSEYWNRLSRSSAGGTAATPR
jgi:flavin reductase (DIM6/NTAB) family NADH-FMN oxidoreductase RutF